MIITASSFFGVDHMATSLTCAENDDLEYPCELSDISRWTIKRQFCPIGFINSKLIIVKCFVEQWWACISYDNNLAFEW